MKWILSLLISVWSINSYGHFRHIHVITALCDNQNQGIVPVPAKIGNGKDPANNLYWGCGYGTKTFLKKQADWIVINQYKNPTETILERIVFRHRTDSVYLVADAYDGAAIKQAISDFLYFSAGQKPLTIETDSGAVPAGGLSDLICYVGHDGLMDFRLDNYPHAADTRKREVVILACASKTFFYQPLKQTGATPLLWTTHLMCPEAYTLDAAIDSWIIKDAPEITREKAAQAYNQYQKCGINGARNLLVTGF